MGECDDWLYDDDEFDDSDVCVHGNYGRKRKELFKAAQQFKEQIAKAALDAAVRWLSEHPPIVPTDVQAAGLGGEDCDDAELCRIPDPEFEIPSQLMGRTFTQAQADQIINAIKTSVHGYESPSPAPKPEVTEYTVSCQFCCGGFENIGPTFDGTSAARECCVCKGTGKRKQWRDSNGTYTRDPRSGRR
jgi:hypothetical protein